MEALLDEVLTRPDLDAERTACLGGSFGGYMTNWIAGHTDRFRAIVTHGLWALDQQHTTTDGAHWKSTLFGTPADHPEYAQNSPHHVVDRITTLMLVVHGNRDYRVPVSEALRLWWDLVSRFDGSPKRCRTGSCSSPTRTTGSSRRVTRRPGTRWCSTSSTASRAGRPAGAGDPVAVAAVPG